MTRSGTSRTVDTGYQFNGQAAGNGQTLECVDPAPPPLFISSNRSKTWFRIGCIVAILDVPIMPIVYFYALRYKANLSLQDGMLQLSQSTPLTLNKKSIRHYNWSCWFILLHSLYHSKSPLIPEEETFDIRASRVDEMWSRRSFQCAEIYPTAL